MRFSNFSYGPGAFRLTLAAAVFLSHVSRFDYGRPAVMLFFMLSGYWVAAMQDGPHRLKYLGYILSRFLRIWPDLFVTAIAVFVAYKLVHLHEPGSLKSTISVLGLATRANDLIGTVWSLDIECQFYLLLPILLLSKPLLSNPARLAVIALVSFAAGCGVYLEWKASTILLYFPMFAAGFAIYLYRWRCDVQSALMSLGVGLTALTVVIWPAFSFARHPQFDRDIVFIATSLLFIPFISWNVGQRSGRRDRHLGNFSYPFYLVHEPCVLIILALYAGIGAKMVALCVALVLTSVLYLLIDRPANKIRSLISEVERRRAVLAASPVDTTY